MDGLLSSVRPVAVGLKTVRLEVGKLVAGAPGTTAVILGGFKLALNCDLSNDEGAPLDIADGLRLFDVPKGFTRSVNSRESCGGGGTN